MNDEETKWRRKRATTDLASHEPPGRLLSRSIPRTLSGILLLVALVFIPLTADIDQMEYD